MFKNVRLKKFEEIKLAQKIGLTAIKKIIVRYLKYKGNFFEKCMTFQAKIFFFEQNYF